MDVTFVNPGVDYMVRATIGFQTEGEADFWTEPLYHFYPQIDKAYATGLSFSERKAYIERTLRACLYRAGGHNKPKGSTVFPALGCLQKSYNRGFDGCIRH